MVPPCSVHHPAGDGQAEPGAAAGGPLAPGEAFEDPVRARPAAMPGPSSRDLEHAARRRPTGAARRRPVPPGGLCRAALSSRFSHDLVQPVPVGRRSAVGRGRHRDRSDLAAGAGRRDLGLGHHLVEEAAEVERASGRSGATPASMRDRSSSSVDQAAEPLGLGQRGAQRRAGRARATPSTRFSSTACSAVIGVRSSCDTFAISSRRCWSAAARSAAIWLNACGQLADLVAGGGPYPVAVVAAGHRPGGGGHLAQRRGHAVRQDLRGEQGAARSRSAT